jgi:hypothetical protein
VHKHEISNRSKPRILEEGRRVINGNEDGKMNELKRNSK